MRVRWRSMKVKGTKQGRLERVGAESAGSVSRIRSTQAAHCKGRKGAMFMSAGLAVSIVGHAVQCAVQCGSSETTNISSC